MSAPTLPTHQLERLLAVGRSMVSKRDPEEVLQDVLEAARELTGARYAALGTLAPDGRELDRFLFVGIGEEMRQRIGPLPRGHGILGEVIRHPEPLRLARISDHPRSYGFPAHHPPMDTFLGVPVMIRGEVFGNLYLTEKEDGEEFDEADERLLVVLAEWAAIAIDNARAHAGGARQRRDLERAILGLEAIVSLSREVGGGTDVPRVLELVVKRGRALVEARSCLCLLLEGDTLTVADVAGEVDRALVGRELPPGSPAEDVVRAGRSQRISERAVSLFGEVGMNESSGVLAPLRARGVDVGVLALFGRAEGQSGFTADDELAVESFAAAAATSIAATRAIEDEKLRLSMVSSERERARWARELHDETLQELGALTVMLESALQLEEPQRVHGAVEQAHNQAEAIIDGVRGLINELRPAALDQLGLAAGVDAVSGRITARTGLPIELDLDLAYEEGREPTRLDPELDSIIYRTVQEALTNVVKHAEATRARVSVEERDGVIVLVVEDDGRGFQESSEHEGFGLLGMRERAALAGGEVKVTAAPRGGTRLRAEFPVTRATRAD